MSRHSSHHHRNFIFPHSYHRRQMILDYLRDLGLDISELGTKIVFDESEIHGFQGLVDAIFNEHKSRISYIDCIEILEVILCNKFKKKTDHSSELEYSMVEMAS